MKYLVSCVVLMLMLSIGMSLSPRRLLENWGRLTPSLWARLVAGTFLVPPLLALALGNLLPLDRPIMAGLFLIAVVPGAPLMTRGAAQKGFDLQLAASYQVWGALLTPVIVPLLIALGGWLYGRGCRR
jgi:BASS family bile acid:Na+ symporter